MKVNHIIPERIYKVHEASSIRHNFLLKVCDSLPFNNEKNWVEFFYFMEFPQFFLVIQKFLKDHFHLNFDKMTFCQARTLYQKKSCELFAI